MTSFSLPALAVFLGSLLLFGVQPLLGRTLLPSFGGTAAVWVVCLAAYQTLLLAGYLYAHLVNALRPRAQRRLHLALLLLAVVWSAAFALLRPMLKSAIGDSATPALEVLLCVLLFAGLPYILLSANSALIQAWVARGSAGGNVYRLYAVSNLGSFAGLLLYPFLLEPYISMTVQWWGFAAGLAGYALLAAALARRTLGDDPETVCERVCECVGVGGGGEMATTVDDHRPPSTPVDSGRFRSTRHRDKVCDKVHRSPVTDHRSPVTDHRSPITAHTPLWFLLPAISVFLLNAVTAHLTLDVMPLPLLWVALLGLFLLSYVAGFTSFAERHQGLLRWLAALCVLLAALTRRQSGAGGGFALNLAAALGLMFFGALFLHGWFYRLRPHAGRLTLFYLGNAAGGAVGGLLAALAAPLLFKSVAEYPLALALVLAAAVWQGLRAGGAWSARLPGLLLAAAAAVALAVSLAPRRGDRPVVRRERGFFGTLRVLEAQAQAGGRQGVIREFVHGNTVHGIQALIPGKERMPTTYFTPATGGYAILGHPKYRRGEAMRVNILGLGVGVMLSYARTNDYYRCYEISPEVLRVATDPALFTFVSGCPGQVELICRDARKGLEEELRLGVEPYDVLVIDAFTGDNLPYHLSTREAFELYFKMLKPDGILAVNISNWHLRLEPFAKAVSGAFQCPVLGLAAGDDFARLAFASKFVFFCRQPEKLGPLPQGSLMLDLRRQRDIPMPTDERGSFVGAIRWR